MSKAVFSIRVPLISAPPSNVGRHVDWNQNVILTDLLSDHFHFPQGKMLHIFLMWFVCLLDFSGDYEDEESSISWIKVAALMLQMAVKEVLLPGSYSNRKFFWPCCTTSDLNLTRRTFALVLWEIMLRTLRTVVVWVAFVVHWFGIKVDEWSISHKINCIGSFFISSVFTAFSV